jgi:TM2 domain-containing membrane protein YozV
VKDKQTAGLLAIFLGTLGVHKFYLGQNKYGILFLLLIILFPLGMIISVIQGIIWLTQSDEKFNENHGITRQNSTQTVVESSSAFINSNLNKAKKYTQKKISQSYLTSCTWILASELENIQYIFRENGELLISKNGLVEKKNYELIVDNNSLLITDNTKTELHNIILVQNDFLFLNKVSENKILRFANQTKFKDLLKSEFIKLANELEYELNKNVG